MSEWDDVYLDEPELPQPERAVSLTIEQDKIADHHDGPMIVLAGAGSGKTATLCIRTGRLIERGVMPNSILILTFSRKAATELKNRLANYYGQDGADVRVDTFHGFGYWFMQTYKDLFGLGEDTRWGIMNESDQNRMLSEISKAHCDKNDVELKKFRKYLLDRFKLWSGLKQDGKCPRNRSDAIKMLAEEHFKKTGEAVHQVSLWDHLAAQTLIDYEVEKRSGGYLDYDDLLLLPLRALTKYPAIAEAIGFQYHKIMVDESQDTNLVQYMMVKKIGINHGNVVMVGDDDQSIYGWRGARVANLRRFMRDFESPIQRLEENFRSHSGIVNSARKLISHNESRLPKKPFSKRQNGLPPALEVSATDREMANEIVSRVKALQKNGVSLSDIAILYRTNRMTQVLEPAFKQGGIPYNVVGGMSFYERAEIQAAIACVRICAKNDDYHALRILQPYIDGVGKKGMSEVIDNLKAEKDKGLLDLALAPGDSARRYGKAGLALKKFLAGVFVNTYLDNDELNRGPRESVAYLVQWMKDGPMKILDREKDDVLRMKRDRNLEQLIDEIGNSGCNDWIEYLMEAPISDYAAEKADSDFITLSTIHRSKGLEWPHVMIAGFSEGIMPMDRAATNPNAKSNDQPSEGDDDGGKPEEERRTAYVAITRAAETCSLFHACEYRFPGSEPTRLDISSYAIEMGLAVKPSQSHLLDNGFGSPSIDFPEEETSGVSAVFRGSGLA